MKKIVFALVVFLLAAPAWADVIITCANEPDACDLELVTISYTATSEANLVRAIALDITVSGDGQISDVNCLSPGFGYHIYLGSIDIDSEGTVQDWGNCKCSGDYAGTLDDVNQMTVEMASLYEAGVEEEPCKEGDLVSFHVGGTGIVTVNTALNAIRGELVMENVNEEVNVDTSSICTLNLVVPTCWMASECAGQPLGDATCDGDIDFDDLGALKVSFFKSKGDPDYDCCTDFTQDEVVDFDDLGLIKVNFFTTGLTPSTLNQNCPP